MIICGLDECGRGALAGPLVAAGVILHYPAAKLIKLCPAPIRDSKRLTPLQRQKITTSLTNKHLSVLIETITVKEINHHGISWSNRQVFHKIIKELSADHYVIDGNLKLNTSPSYSVTCQIKADDQVLEVALASIFAKVYRDNLMQKLHHAHPVYHWFNNKGYGSQQHIQALADHGSCFHHRHIFVQTALKNAG